MSIVWSMTSASSSAVEDADDEDEDEDEDEEEACCMLPSGQSRACCLWNFLRMLRLWRRRTEFSRSVPSGMRMDRGTSVTRRRPAAKWRMVLSVEWYSSATA